MRFDDIIPAMAILTSPKVRFSVREYLRMSEAGVFGGRRVELLDGRIFQMHAQANPHMASITKCMILLSRFFGDIQKFWLSVQGTYVIEPYDAPDPDLMVRDVPVSTPDAKLPTPFLVIEVANTSYKRDGGVKLRRYAAAGVQDYWIVNIPEKRVEVYRKPSNPTGVKLDWRYDDIRFFDANQSIELLAHPKIPLAVRDMLP